MPTLQKYPGYPHKTGQV